MKNLYACKTASFRLLLFSLVSFLSISGKADPAHESKDNQIEITLSKMTLDQKAQLLIGTGFYMNLPDSILKMLGLNPDQKQEIGPAYSSMVDHVRTFLPGAAGFSSEFPDLGISSQVFTDGPAGIRIQPQRKGDNKTYYCTAFPIATMLASTWDTELVYNVGKAMGNEAKEYGSDIMLAPALNIQRDPLCGRNFEYYSEDPLIAGKMAAAMINGIQSNGVGASIKHFAANNSETNRLSVNTIVSERALREIYLNGFEIAVKESQPWTVMSSYNKINGIYASESYDLLTRILRDDWGFKGYVLTDWGGGSDVVAQMKAGNDLIMPGQSKNIQNLVAAVKNGKIDEKILDINIKRILGVMMKTPRYNIYRYSNAPDLAAHALVTRKAATDGMILLKNDGNTLPIHSEIKKIAAFGITSYDFIAGGTGSGDVNEAYTVSLFDGLKSADYVPDSELTNIYDSYIKETKAKQGKPKNWLAALTGGKEPIAEMIVTVSLAEKIAEKADIGLITIGRNSGEGADRTATEGDFYLNSTEKEMIENVSNAFHKKNKKTIVILNVGGVIETSGWSKNPDAILLAWQPGQEAGNSVTDILSGKVNPSGKLAVTFPVKYSDSPTAKNFPGHNVTPEVTEKTEDLSGVSFMQHVPWEIVYEEDVFVGYRYYNSFHVPVSYEFGYGLSYTNFEYGKIKLNSSNFAGQLLASVEVKNIGSVEGREVVQVYLNAPSVKMAKPEETLINFNKTKLLKPGESQTLSFRIEPRDLASFAESTSSWIAESGEYSLKIGSSSLSIKQSATFNLPGDIVVEKVSKALVPNRAINLLKPKSTL